jgi:phospholipid/cholesterol/gamma-HCH transport system substrate-binding protein
MDRDTNYVVVGAFVVLVLAMAASFLFWATDQQEKRTYHRYEIYFQGTVAGLTAGSPVRYLGVDVGKVVRVMLDPEQRRRVEVLVDIDSQAPLDSRTLASLSLQGVTGLLFIDLEQDPKASGPADPLADGHRYPVIRSARSEFDQLLASLPALANRMIDLVDHFNQVFSDQNARAISETLENTRRASARLPDTVHQAELLLADLRHASQEATKVAQDLSAITAKRKPDIEAAIANARHITDRLADTSDTLDRFVSENEPTLTRFTRQSLPEFEQLLRESREAARDFRDLSRSLKQNPSQLLYESNYHGVEVPR